MIEDVFNPVELFRGRLKGEIEKNVRTLFEEMVQKSGVDEGENRKLVAKIRKLERQIHHADGKRRFVNIASAVLITTAVVCSGILLLFGGNAFFPNVFEWEPQQGLILFGVLAGPTAGFVHYTLLRPLSMKIKDQLDELRKELKEQIGIALSQLKPLHSQFTWGMLPNILANAVPRLELDPFFLKARLAELEKEYGWDSSFNENRSVVFAHSGQLNGNPFVIAETLDFKWGERTYTGYKNISWQEREHYTDHEGRSRTRMVTRTQTLSASVTRPFPTFTRSKFIVYGNEAAPELKFSRKPSHLSAPSGSWFHAWRMSRATRRLEKHSRNLHDKSQFTMMANKDFEVLFGATNRNNETQFRILFTPLAQQQMLGVLRDQSVGFGDDFQFRKKNKVNIVRPRHLQEVDISGDPQLFVKYCIDESRSFFNKYCNAFCRHVFFAMAPLLAIPVYQRNRSRNDIFRNVKMGDSCFWEHEAIANYYGQAAFKNPQSVTENILKTRETSTGHLSVSAHGFKSVPQVHVAHRLGGDGNMHAIHVHWERYDSVVGTGELIKAELCGRNPDEVETGFKSSRVWASAVSGRGASIGRQVLRRDILSWIVQR